MSDKQPTTEALRFGAASEAAFEAFAGMDHMEQLAYLHEWARAGDVSRIRTYTRHALQRNGVGGIEDVDGVLVLVYVAEEIGEEPTVSDE